MNPTYWRNHLLLPLLLFMLVAATVEILQLDIPVANAIFNLEGRSWSLRDHWLLEDILHTGVRKTMVALVLLLLISWISTFFCQNLHRYRSGLGYMSGSILLATLVVALGKKFSHVDCPWSLSMFGGSVDYIAIFSIRPEGMPKAQCFPAGHASAGYGWLGIYFLLYHYAPRWRWAGFCTAIMLGLLLGIVQQFRGAHFLSHDIWTFGICWVVAALLYPILLAPQRRADSHPGILEPS